ncbi:MAG: metal-dependent transcriptional regulator [Candidatus Dormibacter sp.]|uniref:metal-dependent transcriptional regulator n=1 Tax=Candidatus Dormibacter sp. TaxID=2973982 RepID=UPI0026993FDA
MATRKTSTGSSASGRGDGAKGRPEIAAEAAGAAPSEVISRYLEAMYYIDAEGESVRSARLADWLGVSRPTVTVALRRMVRDGMVRLDGRKQVVLTDKGRQAAASVVRRHRIMERWLTDSLGLNWLQADEEAARLEHAVSEAVEQKLWDHLGRPLTCPHGNPIPGHAELNPDEVRLASLPQGSTAVVTRISEVAEREAPTLLRYLWDRRLVPGAALSVMEADPVGLTLRLKLADREVVLSHETAAKLWTRPEASATRRPPPGVEQVRKPAGRGNNQLVSAQ